jgi:prepilin-type N-terminal cleavage/methylation domain-containing protein
MRPLARRPRHPTASFTLVEILVALAIFSVVLVILGSMLTFAGSIYKDGHGRVENFTKSRAMLDLIAGDLQNGVFRPDLPAFGTGSQYGTTNGMTALFNAGPTNAFYTRRAGVGANVRPLSLVVYSLTATTATLQRSDYAVPWTPATDWSGYLPLAPAWTPR